MSRVKRYLEEISEDMGFGGEINDEVMERANEIRAHQIERAHEERMEREFLKGEKRDLRKVPRKR